MVHGAGAGGWEWRLWERIFEAGGWDVLAPDLEPHTAGVGATTVDHYVNQVRSWLDMDGAPPFLIGASMGGLLAAQAAARAPLSGLVLVNSLPPGGVEGWPLAPVRFPTVISWPTRRVQESLRDMPDYESSVEEVFPEMWREESGVVMNALYRGVPVAPPQAPCLVMAGEADEDVPPRVAQTLAGAFDADFLRLAKTSHLGILLGRRAQFAAALALEWIECIWVEQEGLDAFDVT